MRSRRLSVVWAIVVAAVVAALTGSAAWALERGVQQQSSALLRNDASQVSTLLLTDVQTITSQLGALGTATVEAGNSQAVFASQAKAIVANPGASVALVDMSGAAAHVLFGAGPAFTAGQDLGGPLLEAVLQSSNALSSSGVLHLAGRDELAMSEVPPAVAPTTVVLELVDVTPSKASASASGPYSQLDIALYASSRPDPTQLVVSTSGSPRLPSPTVSVPLRVGRLHWDLVSAAKVPLVGSAARAAPWVVLFVGLALAVAIGSIIEVLMRRQRHAAQLVAQREAELSEAQAVLVRQERLSAVGEMAAVIGHDLRNPLGAAVNSLYLVRKSIERETPDEIETHLARSERAVYRAASMAEDLMNFVRDPDPEMTELDLRQVVDETIESSPPPAGVTLDLPAPGLTVSADRDQFVRVLTNVIVNSYQAMPDGGRLAISAQTDANGVVISVADSGPGIDSKSIDSLFQPFYTTKTKGTGLGLSIVKRIVDRHRGTVTIGNGPEGGAITTIRLPRG